MSNLHTVGTTGIRKFKFKCTHTPHTPPEIGHFVFTNTCPSSTWSFCLIGIHSSTFAYCFVGPSTWLSGHPPSSHALLAKSMGRFGNCSFVLECLERFCLIVELWTPVRVQLNHKTVDTSSRQSPSPSQSPGRQHIIRHKGLPQSSVRVSPIFFAVANWIQLPKCLLYANKLWVHLTNAHTPRVERSYRYRYG